MIPPVVVRIAHDVGTVIGVPIAGMVVSAIVRWADGRTDAPIMLERINSASDGYFEEERARAEEEALEGLTFDLDVF